MLKIGIYLRARDEMGGTLQYNLGLLAAARLLPRDRYQIILASTDSSWQDRLRDSGLVHVPLGRALLSRISAELWGRLRLPVSLWRAFAPHWHPLTRRMMREKCDVWLFPSQDSLAYWIPVTALCSVHDLMHRYEPTFEESASPAQFRYREYHYANLARWCAGILVDSPTGAEHVAESYGADRQRLHSLPFIPPDYIYRAVTEADRRSVRERYQLPDKFFFYPAQFWKHKNHELLLHGLHRNLAAHSDMRLVFCGGRKNNYDAVIALIDRLGLGDRVSIIGYVPDDDMASVYHCARALLMPTFFGPTNIPPLEAMVCGCPAAVSRIYGMPDQLGDAALYFDPRSVDEAAAVMAALWSDDELCRRLREKGHERAAAWGVPQFSARLGGIVDTVVATVAGSPRQ